MKQIVTASLVILLTAGCSTPRGARHLDCLADKTIAVLEFKQVPVQEVLRAIRDEWKKQTGTEMPVAEVKRYIEYAEPKDQLVTFRARHVSFLDALRVTADLSGYQLTFSENGVILTDIWPGEFGWFEWRLDTKTRVGLGLAEKPDANAIREALASRGVDFSKGDMNVTLLADDLVLVRGFTENSELAKSILMLVKTGYEVKKREEPQQTNVPASSSATDSKR